MCDDVAMAKNILEGSGPSILVPPGIELRQTVRGQLNLTRRDVSALEKGQEILMTFRLEYSSTAGYFEVAAFGIDRGESPIEISGAFLRTVRVHTIARRGILAALPSWALEVARLRHLRGRGGLRSFPEFTPTDDDALLLTGLIYRVAEISGENPALAVAESIGLKQRTATNWIQRSRAAGYLTSTEHGAAAKRVAKAIEPMWIQFTAEEWEATKSMSGKTGEELQALLESAVTEALQPDSNEVDEAPDPERGDG